MFFLTYITISSNPNRPAYIPRSVSKSDVPPGSFPSSVALCSGNSKAILLQLLALIERSLPHSWLVVELHHFALGPFSRSLIIGTLIFLAFGHGEPAGEGTGVIIYTV